MRWVRGEPAGPLSANRSLDLGSNLPGDAICDPGIGAPKRYCKKRLMQPHQGRAKPPAKKTAPVQALRLPREPVPKSLNLQLPPLDARYLAGELGNGDPRRPAPRDVLCQQYPRASTHLRRSLRSPSPIIADCDVRAGRLTRLYPRQESTPCLYFCAHGWLCACGALLTKVGQKTGAGCVRRFKWHLRATPASRAQVPAIPPL